METVLILLNRHQLVALASQSCILGSILPILAVESCLGINGIGHIETGLEELLALAIALLIEGDGLVEVVVNLLIGLGLSSDGLLAQTLVDTQHDTIGVTLMIAPTVGVELSQTEERVSTESKGLSLDEFLIVLLALGCIDIVDDGIGIAHQLVIIEPRINGIVGSWTQVVG